MEYIRMKIVGFDEVSGSLLVSYASDTTRSQDPSSYPAYAYQPMKMWPDITDPELIKQKMAIAGISVVQNQTREEQFVEDPVKIEQYQTMVGIEVQYPISQLIPPSEDIEES